MSTIPIPDSSAEHQDPCPTPLAWREVLDAFRRDSERWEVPLSQTPVQGRTIGEGMPLYFLNGFSGSLELYALTAWLLREQFRCVLLDYPSHARLSADDMGQMLLGVANYHKHDQFHIFANTLGAIPALKAAIAEPQQIQRIILQGGFGRRRLSRIERILSSGADFLPPRMQFRSVRERIHQQNHRQWFPPYDHSRWEFFVSTTLDVSIQSLALRAAALASFDVRPDLPHIENPVLLIRTEGDGIRAARDQEELAEGLPHAQTESLHTCGLLPFLTHPHRLTKCINEFLLEQHGS